MKTRVPRPRRIFTTHRCPPPRSTLYTGVWKVTMAIPDPLRTAYFRTFVRFCNMGEGGYPCPKGVLYSKRLGAGLTTCMALGSNAPMDVVSEADCNATVEEAAK